MQRLSSIYRDQDRAYRADTCEPVKAAVRDGTIEQMALKRGAYPGRPLAKDALPGVLTVGYWDAARDQNWGLDWHRNEGLEITFLETGRLDFAVGGHNVEGQREEFFQQNLRPDDFTVTRPWQPHRIGDPNITASKLHFLILDVGVRHPHTQWKWPKWLVLTPEDLERLTIFLRHNEQPVWQSGPDLRHCFGRIARAVMTDKDGANISRLTVCLNELFVLLLDIFESSRATLNESLSSSSRTVELFLAEFSQNQNDLAAPWSVAEMARHCGMGVTHFTHLVKQLTNLTPIEYLNRCRIDSACRLLREKRNMTVTRVAMTCGFSSSQYFAAVFRRQLGCTPRVFRAEQV
ncbi:MAG: helix-turn-helix transcriptional regulator [Pirellulales bacterium]|nr:helix-turn-helix transcriptional regulator [Pirellulales bacterium]